MSKATGGEIAGSMDRVARITLSLGGFMLVLLIAAPFTFDTDSSGSLMWLNDPRRKPERERRIRENSSPMLSEDQQKVVDILSSKGNSMWQAELVRDTGFTNSKASRLLSRMEAEGHIRRIRDGMGKRVELKEVEI